MTGGGYEANVVRELGGRICRLTRNGLPNVLDPEFGVDAVQGLRDYTRPATQVYDVKKLGGNKADIWHTWRRQYTLKRTAQLGVSGLTVTNAFTSQKTESQAMRPILRAAFDLGDASAVCVSSGADTWQTVVVDEDEICRLATCKGVQPGQVLILASPVTGRAVAVHLPSNPLDHVQVMCDVRNQRVALFAVVSSTELAGRQTLTVPWQIEVLKTKPELPAVKVPKEHRAERLTIEDFQLSIGRRGQWGDYVSDPLAADGTALKLYNTHYEWCTQWRVDPSWFEKAGQYKVRMRIRVDKSGQGDGEAFWAGVYDTARKRGYGQIAPKVSQVQDGYQWYDVATWQPEAKQYVWIGPCRFDKKTLKTNPAIKAVYIDRIELVRVAE
jgi:hypothetical protein